METKATNPKTSVGTRKTPMSVAPMNVMMETGVAMLEGACKHGRHNYRECGARASVYLDGTMRHLAAWWEGKDIDPDSGLSHVTKAIASLVVLRDAMVQEVLVDDRPPAGSPFMAELNRLACEILDRYGDREVKHYTREGRQEAVLAGADGRESFLSYQEATINFATTFFQLKKTAVRVLEKADEDAQWTDVVSLTECDDT
ncbi:MAG TPA: DUF5664 domain-containing protein [Phycisphaerae bacterium]|nr:DUF5664 domain-containing protein [Phycisphaerae bacterium]